MSKRVIVSAVMACAAATAAQAQSTVFAVDLRAAPNRLLSFPSNAPANNSIATTPYDGFAIDFNGTASALYGITALPAGGQILGTIDTTSGAFNNVAAVNGAIAGITNYGGMSYNASNGLMYVLASTTVPQLYTLDLTTAALTLVTPITGGPTGALYIDIAIDNAGNAYLHDIATDVMLSLNTATGVATSLGATGFNANFAQGMDFDPVTNVLYAAIYTGGGTGAYCSVNTVTGACTSLVSTTTWNAEMEMAIAPAPGAAALLGLAGLMASRRRR